MKPALMRELAAVARHDAAYADDERLFDLADEIDQRADDIEFAPTDVSIERAMVHA